MDIEEQAQPSMQANPAQMGIEEQHVQVEHAQSSLHAEEAQQGAHAEGATIQEAMHVDIVVHEFNAHTN